LSVCAVNAAKNGQNKAAVCTLDVQKEYKKLQKVIGEIEKSAQDNYLYILPVYNANYQIDTLSKTWQTLSSIMQKAETEIRTAAAQPPAYCPNIAEIYKLKGIALFYQKQYQSAYEAFDTVAALAKDSVLWAEAHIWLARTDICLDEYENVEFFLKEAGTYIDTNQKEVYVHFHNVVADNYIQIEDYSKALEHLAKSINTGSSTLNTRLTVIAGQIAERQKAYRLALSYYNNVNKKHLSKNNLMESYTIVQRHLCEKNIERQYFDSIAEEEWKASHPVPKEFEPTIVESYYDSSFFGNSYPYYFNDYASMFFLNESEDFSDEEYYDEDSEYPGDGDAESELSDEMLESIFDNWESISVHIPKTDFSHLKDTIYIPLIDADSNYELPHFGAVVSRFGWRRYRYHYGTDLKGVTGDNIYCVFDGVVRIAVRNKTYGNVVIVRHYNGLETFYAHCSKMLVSPNQEVKAGELIGLIGNTGRSRGPHLHFEVRYKGSAFNPEYMIDFENKQLKSDTLVLTKEVFNYKNTYSTSSSSSSSGTGNVAGYHKVKSGETLSSIAKRYRTSVSNLKNINGLKSDFIREGQRLKVP
jgi:murein DD-endopeptidase MepM/ murein hydrolase activator NlpD